MSTLQNNNFEYFIVLDFEATCDVDRNKSLSTQEIIEWPVMIIDIKSKKILNNKFHHYIKPKIHPKITPFCTKLTGITQKMVDKSNTIIDIVNKWNIFCLDNKLIIKKDNKLILNACVITCGDWDLQKMWKIQSKLDKNIPDIALFDKWINIEYIYNKYYGKSDKKCYGMMNILRNLNIKHVGQHHSGIDDVHNICNIVLFMLNDKLTNIDWKHTSNKDEKFIDLWNNKPNQINKKFGDWECIKCKYLNFASRDICNSCKASKPQSSDNKQNKKRGKPWKCDECNYFNFGSNNLCKRCQKGKKPINNIINKNNNNNTNKIERKEGDWDCLKCGEMNFKFRRFCMKCKLVNPNNKNNNNNDTKIEKKPGDWICVKCNTINFKFRQNCFGCNAVKNNENNDEIKVNNNEIETNKDTNNVNDNKIEKKPGDWICIKCKTLNFKFRKNCFGCDFKKVIENNDEIAPDIADTDKNDAENEGVINDNNNNNDNNENASDLDNTNEDEFVVITKK